MTSNKKIANNAANKIDINNKITNNHDIEKKKIEEKINDIEKKKIEEKINDIEKKKSRKKLMILKRKKSGKLLE
ncbi:hypothetical protein B1U22_05335 (plasmid) [Borreliella burgdorferi]|uniref:hypothetical protein n=1 Tax=Borreliella burgdorferi TaxID=139 RepID=UPI000307489A|nr:hypothetical protein [Borreliella burgdorferi]ARS32031.1 hypothetical protein B1U22_05335 [Borreliella burgdorferi]ARS32534.1 hypothetical protein B1U21_01300 [Borreliella burgdorferi]MCR8876646.1 hypothetical protein [Borreliella burgdorferi]PNL87287.1 hypothetical protein A6J35_005820 [Borreliella burgdorferi]PRR09491.1 hypothetical protein CV660_06940 [Borreliella burgdorferi]